MSKFHNYSIGNLILIMLQKPNAPMSPASVREGPWPVVKKSEKELQSWLPACGRKEPKMLHEKRQQVKAKNWRRRRKKRFAPVFQGCLRF